MAEILEFAQLLQDDGVAEVDVGRRRVEAELRAQLATLARGRLEPLLKAPGGSDCAALRVRNAACEAGSEAASAIRANASLRPGAGVSRRTSACQPDTPTAGAADAPPNRRRSGRVPR